MANDRMRYRLQTRSAPRLRWAEWGPFLLAIIAAACLLFVLARHSPLFTLPKALPESGAVNQGDASGGHSGGKEQQAPPAQ